jgi:hypothetical protein
MVGIPAINPRGHRFKENCPAGGYVCASFRDHLRFASETAALSVPGTVSMRGL